MKKHSIAFLITLLLGLSSSFVFGQTATSDLKYGKYGCTSSQYVNGFYEFTPRGSFVLYKNGTYAYLGFKEPSTGKFTIDKKGNLLFSGGYFDKGKAEKIDRPNKFFLVFPTIPGYRWTCTWAENNIKDNKGHIFKFISPPCQFIV